jgi:hypothetical protein
VRSRSVEPTNSYAIGGQQGSSENPALAEPELTLLGGPPMSLWRFMQTKQQRNILFASLQESCQL